MQERLDTSNDGQDDIDASKAPLIEHLIELRTRLIYALIAFAFMFAICFAFAQQIYNILVWPYIWASGDPTVRLIATHFLEQLYTHLKLAMFGAAFLSFPVVATQVYMFIAPGLYKNERNAFIPYLVATPVFFLAGAMIVYFIAMPILIQFSIGLTQTAGDGRPAIELMPKVSEYLSLIMTLIFGFGMVFQLPVVLTLLARAGMIGADTLRKGRPYAAVAIFVVAAMLTPPDIISQVIMALPTMLLYELSILAVTRVEAQNAAREAARDAD